jgi:ABC-type nitrate/sulfonate/bicarbonate transport system substrate-binding protein
VKQKLNKIAVSVGLAVLLAASMASRSFAQATPPATPFTIAIFQSEGYLPDFVAKEKGFGEKHGIDIRFVTPASGSAAAQLLLAGAVQGWTTDPLIILTAASRGYDIKVAGSSAPHLAYTVMASAQGRWPPDSASLVDRIRALKGKRIGVSGIGAGTDNALLALLKIAGLGVADVTRVAIGQQQAAIGQLSAGRIDAFVSFSLAGNAVIREQTGARQFISTLSPDAPASIRLIPQFAFAVSGEFAAKNPAAVQGWLQAEADAVAWIRAHPDDAAVILNKYVFNDKNLDLAKTIVPLGIQSYFKDTRLDFKLSESAFDAIVQEGRDVAAFKDTREPAYKDVVLPFARLTQ